MNKLILSWLFLVIASISYAQSPGIYVNLEENKAYIEVVVDTNGVIQLKDSLNGVITFTFPDSNYLNWRIKFNESKKVFYVGFSCEGDSCIKIQLGDIKNKQLKLTFSANNLIGIGERIIKSQVISTAKPYVKIIKDKNEKPKDIYDELKVNPDKDPQLSLTPDATKYDSYKFYCGQITCLDCQKDSSGKFSANPVNEARYSLFSKVFLNKNTFHDKFSRKDITPKYWIIYDNRDGKRMIPYYFKVHNWMKEKNFLKIKTRLYPQAYRQVVITIIGPSDTSYYTVDGRTADHFTEIEKDMKSTLDGIKPGSSATDGGTVSEKKADNGLVGVLADTDNSIQKRRRVLGETKSMLAENRTIDQNTLNMLNALVESCDEILSKLNTAEKKNNELESALAKEKAENALSKKTLEDSIAKLTAKLDENIKQIARLTKLTESIGKVTELGEKLIALEKGLEMFNYAYNEISFLEDRYKLDLLCLQLKIKDILGIPAPNNPKDLAQYLIALAKSTDKSKSFYVAYTYLIKQLEAQYKEALNKKAKWSLFSVSKKIPNNDEFITTFTTPKGIKPFFSDSFNISGGLKIDFSTGIYVSGLANPNYILAPHPYQYREIIPVVVPGSSGLDSTTYVSTGRLVDTTGSLIQENKPLYSYSTGFLFHIYPRTGWFANLGLAGGVTITNSNSSPIQLMLGLSTMFNSGKSRVSITGGVVWGQVRTISTVAESYVWKPSVDPNRRIYDNRNDLPLFYQASSDIPTYDQWKHSLFLGLSYNFASLTVGK